MEPALDIFYPFFSPTMSRVMDTKWSRGRVGQRLDFCQVIQLQILISLILDKFALSAVNEASISCLSLSYPYPV